MFLGIWRIFFRWDSLHPTSSMTWFLKLIRFFDIYFIIDPLPARGLIFCGMWLLHILITSFVTYSWLVHHVACRYSRYLKLFQFFVKNFQYFSFHYLTCIRLFCIYNSQHVVRITLFGASHKGAKIFFFLIFIWYFYFFVYIKVDLKTSL